MNHGDENSAQNAGLKGANPRDSNLRDSNLRDSAIPQRGWRARLWRPRGLFWKIFGWFLAAQLLIALALTALTAATQRGFDQRFNEMLGTSLEARARAAAIAYERGGQNALREAWQSARRIPNRDDPAPNPPAQRPSPKSPVARAQSRPDPNSASPPDNSLPDNSLLPGPPPEADGNGGTGRRFGRGRGFDGGFRLPRRGPNDLEASSLYVLSAAPKDPARLVARHLIGPMARLNALSIPADKNALPATYAVPNGAIFLLRRVETARGGRYLAVLRMRRDGQGLGPGRAFGSWLGIGNGAPGTPGRLAVIALTMGALCYALARYLTDPALKLRRATQKFAAGDFGARVGPQLGARRDELADLGHDFDRMAERIEGLLLSQRQLLGDISHELRSPLTRLSLSLELAGQNANAPTQALLGRMESDVGEMNRLIGQLLTIARLENGASALQQNSREAAYIDLAHLVEHVAETADFEAKNRGGSVTITALEACQIVGNGELLHSALENVVRNAILHSVKAPRVEISLRHEKSDAKSGVPSRAILRVRDFGPGVPEAALEAMFRPFFRVDAARDRQSGGTGLGLSITQRAARFHGGDVRAQNAVGGGLEVEISLPLAEDFEAK